MTPLGTRAVGICRGDDNAVAQVVNPPPPIPSQMASLTLLLAMRDGGTGSLVVFSGVAGPALLCVAAYLTVWSLVLYLRQLWPYMH